MGKPKSTIEFRLGSIGGRRLGSSRIIISQQYDGIISLFYPPYTEVIITRNGTYYQTIIAKHPNIMLI
jgi:hypothetical protein